jgi:hypothetical protein
VVRVILLEAVEPAAKQKNKPKANGVVSLDYR